MITNTRSDRGVVLVVALIMLAMITFLVVAFVGFARLRGRPLLLRWNGHSPADAISNTGDVAEDVLRLMRANKEGECLFPGGIMTSKFLCIVIRQEMGSTIDCRHFWISIHPLNSVGVLVGKSVKVVSPQSSHFGKTGVVTQVGGEVAR